MPITATFAADFSSFSTAVQKAEVELRSFEDGAGKVEKALGRIGDNFSGRKVIQEAQLTAKAIEDIGGVSRLTENELQRVATQAQEAVAKMKALGLEVPQGIQKIADAAKSTQSGFADLLGPLGQANNLLGLFGAGLSVGAVVGFGREVFRAADGLTRMADQTGIGIVALQRLQAVAEPSGNSLEQVTSAVTQMQKRIAEGAKGTEDALKDLRLSLSDVRTMNPDDAFFAIAQGIQAIKDPAEQTRVAMELFGRSGGEILPTLKADIDALKDSTVKMSDESAKALDDLGDAFGRWKSDAVSAIGEVLGQMALLSTKGNELTDGNLGNLLAPGGLMGGLTGLTSQSWSWLGQQIAPTPVAPTPAGSQIQQGAGGFGTAGLRDLLGASSPLGENANSLKAISDELALAEQRASGFTAAMAELGAAVGKASVTVAGMNGEVVEAVKFYLQAGVSQSTLQKAYALTATEVAAVAKVLVEEKDALKLEQDAIAATTRMWSEYDAVRTTQGSTATQQAIADVIRWSDATAAAAQKAGTDTAAFYEALAATTTAKLQGIAVDWSSINTELSTGTKVGLQEIADKAQATYQAALAHVGEFSDGAIQRFRDTADAAQLAANAFGTGFESASVRATAALQETVNQAAKAKAALDMMFAGDAVPTSESLSAAAMRPGSFLGFGGGTMQQGTTGFVSNLPWPARANGGPVSSGQPYMVGERGPELFTPGQAGFITPNGGGVGSITVNISAGVFDRSTVAVLADQIGTELLRRVNRRLPSA